MPKRERGRGATREELESKELNILSPPGPVVLPLARPSINQTESRRTGRGLKRNPRGGETGGVVPGSGRHSRLQDPVSRSIFPKVYLTQLRTQISASCTLSVAGTGPAPSSSGPHTVQGTSPTPRLTSSGHPDSCAL